MLSAKRKLISTILIAVVYLFVNSLLSVYRWAPTGRLVYGFLPIVESVAIVAAILATVSLVDPGRRRALLLIIGAIVGVLLGFAIAEGFFQYYYDRHFLPRSDIPMARGAILLFFGAIGRLADVLGALAVAGILVIATVVGVVVVSGAAFGFDRVGVPPKTVIGLFVVAGLIGIAVERPPSLTGIASSVLRPERSLPATAPGMAEVPSDDGAADRLLAGTPVPHGTGERFALPGIRDRDLYVFVIEAYGYTTVSRSDLSDQIDPHRERLRSALEARGYGVVTNYLESPVAGGYSWLAEATFLTGTWIDSQEKFRRLYDANLPTLTGMLYGEGYYTLTFRPGTVHSAWPEGWDLYRFEESFVAFDGDFEYVGPLFSYVWVPDQLTLWIGEQRVRELTATGAPAATKPLVVYYQLVSSHTPYNRIPPVIADWNSLGNGTVFNERAQEIQYFDNTWTGGTQLDEGYIAALTYEFQVLADYVESVMDADRDPILVIFGDHQPQPPIRSRGAVRSVPIHVASRDADVLDRFEAHGYERGMVGTQPAPHKPMNSFFYLFETIARGSSIDRVETRVTNTPLNAEE